MNKVALVTSLIMLLSPTAAYCDEPADSIHEQVGFSWENQTDVVAGVVLVKLTEVSLNKLTYELAITGGVCVLEIVKPGVLSGITHVVIEGQYGKNLMFKGGQAECETLNHLRSDKTSQFIAEHTKDRL